MQNDHHYMQVQDYFTLAKLLALVIIIITGVIQLAKGLVDSRNVIIIIIIIISTIPHICHGSHGYTRVNFFWPV